MDYLTNYYKNLCEQLQDRINVLSKLLNEESDSEPQTHKEMSDADWQEYINSIHSLPLDEAKAHAELSLSSNLSIFTPEVLSTKTMGNGVTVKTQGEMQKIREDHPFYKYLTHPDHTDESVLDDLNFLMKLAYRKDNAAGEPQKNHHQAGIFHFALQNFPTIAYAMGKDANARDRSKPIQISPEELAAVKKEHGSFKTKQVPMFGTYFINSKQNWLMGQNQQPHDFLHAILNNKD